LIFFMQAKISARAMSSSPSVAAPEPQFVLLAPSVQIFHVISPCALRRPLVHSHSPSNTGCSSNRAANSIP